MTTRFQLSCSTRFFASADEVWAIKTDPKALAAEFEPFFRFTGDLDALRACLRGEGLPRTVEARIWAGVLPTVSWPFQFVEHVDGSHFVDRSDNALFSEWEHIHRVEVASDAVRYLDLVRFTPRFGPPHLVGRMVEELFKHRHRRAARKLSSDARATGVALLREDREIDKDGNQGFM
jgi:ligand-binding SRPBCC domain-containing protein